MEVKQSKKNGNKENKAFMILSALGILFVVDEHLGRPIAVLHQIFPYDSFYMPLFMFVSGYFFNTKHCESLHNLLVFVWNKCKKTLFPYFFWVAFYCVFTYILRYFNLVNIGKYTMKTLLQYCLDMGTSYGYNDPAWFVPTLFAVSAVYCSLRVLLKKAWNDTVWMIVLILVGAVAVHGANTEFNTINHYMILKVAFFMQFYHLGFYFKKYIEKGYDKINAVILCAIAIVINVILLSIYGYKISFPYCARMGGFFTNNVFLPLITSVTAIAFWLKISKMLVPILGDNKLVNFISDNTFFIMTHHLTVKALFNGLLILGKKYGLSVFSGVDAVQFKNSVWYTFSGLPWSTTVCFLFTMFVTLVACQMYLRIKEYCFAYGKSMLKRIN